MMMWQWRGDRHNWHNYNSYIMDLIESTYQKGDTSLDVSKVIPSFPYILDFFQMVQINKRTKYHRPIRRIDNEVEISNDSVDSADSAAESSNNSLHSTEKKTFLQQVSNLWNKLKKSPESASSSADEHDASLNKKQCTSQNNTNESGMSSSKDEVISESSPETTSEDKKSSDSNAYATVEGKPWTMHWLPHIPESKLKPVPGIEPLESEPKKKKRGRRKKGSTVETTTVECDTNVDVLETYTEVLTTLPSDTNEEQVCIICCEALSNGSSYDEDTTVVKLQICSHMFHKSCVKAMYDSGQKQYLQCPTCKAIHGIKCGTQPPGSMVYHVMPCSLPGYPECDTIRIIYSIPSGIQGPEHPHPGHRYTTHGFPRHCYLPDNEMGRKVLRLLIKAWTRKLVFTIGTSSTTGVPNTVTWNEIHHKTQFGNNKHGHGFPDPNYFDNVIAELAAQGVTEDTYEWYPV